MANRSVRARLQSLLSFCIIVSPILSLYSKNGISLAIVLVTFSYLLYFIFVDHSFFICNVFGGVLILFAIFVGLLSALIKSTNIDILMRTVQFVVLIFVPLTINPKAFCYSTAKKMYIRIALLASVFLIVQFIVLNIFGIYIPGVINNPIFPPNESIFAITSKTITTSRRVSGLFSEPASHSVYVLGAFILSLYENNNTKQNIISLLLALSVLMSVSSTGIFGLIFAAILYMVQGMLFKKRKVKTTSLLAFFAVIIVLLILSQTSIWALFIQRMDQGTSLNNRFAAYKQPFSNRIDEVLFGHGMDLKSLPSDVYYAGYPRFIYYFGFFGLLLWLLMIISLIRGAKPEIIPLLLMLIFLNIGESIMLGFSGSVFLFIACLGRAQDMQKLPSNSFYLEV